MPTTHMPGFVLDPDELNRALERQRGLFADLSRDVRFIITENATAPVEPAQVAPVAPVEVPENHFQCCECSAVLSADDSVMVEGEELACEPCIEEHYIFVDGDTWIPRRDTRECRCCGERYRESDLRDVDGHYACNGCIENSDSIVYCEDDNDHHWLRNAFFHEGDGCYRTYPESGGDPEMDDEHVYEYRTNVLNVLGEHCFVAGKQVEIAEQLVFGVELETDHRRGQSRESIASALMDTSFKAYGICKSDGTVSGPECVTLPADLDSHRKLYEWDKWIKVLQPIAHGFHGESCGMHVHINRKALSPLTVGKMLVFMNSRSNRHWLAMIAQRDFAANSYCKQKGDKRLVDGRHPNDDRYECLNITRSTVEVRIFRSNLHTERFLKNIEFCHALTQWARDASINELNSTSMQAYIFANAGTYPALTAFIKNKLTIDTSEVK